MRRMYFALLLGLAAGACASGGFKQPIADFQAGVSDTTAVVGVYYTELNSFERDLYLNERLYNPDLEVLTSDATRKPTPLVGQTFEAKAIRARLDALDLLGKYGKRLAALAGTDAPAKSAAEVTSLGDRLTSLTGTFKELSGAGDATAAKYIGPIGTIVGLITQSILESQRDAAITKAVASGKPAVNAILDQIEADLQTIVGPVRITGEKERLSDLIAFYNCGRLVAGDKRSDPRPGCKEPPTLTFAARQALLKEMASTQARYEAAVVFAPAEAVSGLRDAHAALVKYAESGRKNPDRAELAASLEVFRERAAAAAEQIAKLRKIRGGE